MASMVEIGILAYDAGIRSPLRLTDAIAIAVAESGGDPSKVGDVKLQNETWGPSIGLWQIRSLVAESGKGTSRDASRLIDPAFNARSMAEISGSGANWKPWSVTHPATDPAGFARYNAARLAALPAATTVIAGKTGSAAADAVADATGLSDLAQIGATISDAVQMPVRALKWYMDAGTQKRILYGAIGIAAVLIGAYIVAKPAISATREAGAKAAGIAAKAALTKGK